MRVPRIDGPGTATPPVELRIGDAERDAVMAALREHFAQGRITAEELDERLDRTLHARTERDLRAITADLPDLHAADARPAPSHHGHGHHGHGHHGHWDHPHWGAMAGPPAPWRHSHGGPPFRSGPWGPPHRHRHGGHHPPFPLVLIGALVIVSLAAGTAWPLIFAVKALLFGMIAFTIARMLHRRRGGGRR